MTAGAVTTAAHIRRLEFPLLCMLLLVPPILEAPLDLPGNKLAHAHNMFLNKLVEEGIFGLIAMLAFFVFPARALFRDWRADRWKNWLWLSGMGALVVPVVSGSVNTPWYNEHALLAMIVLALYLSSRNPENLGAPGAGSSTGR
ncbi:MAG TPA: hypothetical protein VFV04_02895 [Burkholderiales bacterium]|nr:hypothetical protein [Burkholderiales bacterium]